MQQRGLLAGMNRGIHLVAQQVDISNILLSESLLCHYIVFDARVHFIIMKFALQMHD